LRVEGPWPGSRTALIDVTNLGKYVVEVVEHGTNRLLYTRDDKGPWRIERLSP